MATTHAFAGLALVSPVAYLVPEFALPLAVGAIIGGIAPDLDVAMVHRQTLHFPVYGGFGTLIAVGLTLIAPSPLTAFLTAAVTTAWLHALSDAIGSGPELDPWTNPSNRAVYDHARGVWIRPRHWIRYDGAPEDALIAVTLAVPALFVFGSYDWLQLLIGVGIAVSLAYTLLRRRLVEWVPKRLQ